MSYSCIRVNRGGVEENVYYKDGQFVNSGYLPKSKIRNLKCREQKVIQAGPHNKKTSAVKPKSKSKHNMPQLPQKTDQDLMPVPKRGKTPLPPPKPNKSSFKKYQKKSSVKKSLSRKTPAKSKKSASKKKSNPKSKGAEQRRRAMKREESFRALDNGSNRSKVKSRK